MPNIPISSFTAAANATGIGMSGYSLTGTSAQSMLDLAGTWNTTGTPTGLKLNVTDTASNAASLLMDLQVGGASRFNVSKGGAAVFSAGSLAAPSVTFGDATTGFWRQASNRIGVSIEGTLTTLWTSNVIRLASTQTIGWSSGSPAASAEDTILTRDAANTLAQRNGVNAQTLRVYGTFTDASNFRRVATGMSAAGVGFIRPEGGGTGATGNVLHISGLPTSNPGPGILWNNAGSVAIGT